MKNKKKRSGLNSAHNTRPLSDERFKRFKSCTVLPVARSEDPPAIPSRREHPDCFSWSTIALPPRALAPFTSSSSSQQCVRGAGRNDRPRWRRQRKESAVVCGPDAYASQYRHGSSRSVSLREKKCRAAAKVRAPLVWRRSDPRAPRPSGDLCVRWLGCQLRGPGLQWCMCGRRPRLQPC